MILGDNGEISREAISVETDFPWVVFVWKHYPPPFDNETIRDVRRYDDIDYVLGDVSCVSSIKLGCAPIFHFSSLSCSYVLCPSVQDLIYGGHGNDILHGQRGNDEIHGGDG